MHINILKDYFQCCFYVWCIDDITTTADGQDTYQDVKDAGRYKYVIQNYLSEISLGSLNLAYHQNWLPSFSFKIYTSAIIVIVRSMQLVKSPRTYTIDTTLSDPCIYGSGTYACLEQLCFKVIPETIVLFIYLFIYLLIGHFWVPLTQWPVANFT